MLFLVAAFFRLNKENTGDKKRKMKLKEFERLLKNPEWEKEFGEGELTEINFCNEYVLDFHHGTDGHNRMMIIAKMAVLLDMMEDHLGLQRTEEDTVMISIGKVKDGINPGNKVVGHTLYLENGTFISFRGRAWLAREIFENLIAEKAERRQKDNL